jgi:NADH-quinone oxidoreductase subunit L
MIVGARLSAAYSVGIFSHLFTHAFFKALLFLGAGSVIHAMHHEQDVRNMGGLAPYIRFTTVVMLIGTLALIGFPGTAGYFSKDAVIGAGGAYSRRPHCRTRPVNARLPFFLCTTVLSQRRSTCSFYSWRLNLFF